MASQEWLNAYFRLSIIRQAVKEKHGRAGKAPCGFELVRREVRMATCSHCAIAPLELITDRR